MLPQEARVVAADPHRRGGVVERSQSSGEGKEAGVANQLAYAIVLDAQGGGRDGRRSRWTPADACALSGPS